MTEQKQDLIAEFIDKAMQKFTDLRAEDKVGPLLHIEAVLAVTAKEMESE